MDITVVGGSNVTECSLFSNLEILKLKTRVDLPLTELSDLGFQKYIGQVVRNLAFRTLGAIINSSASRISSSSRAFEIS